jgi:ketosteroid isomerase-like protein
MTEESTTPDLVELVQRVIDAVHARDFEAVQSAYAPNAVLDILQLGATFEGHLAIRGFYEEWAATFPGWKQEVQEILDLGEGMGIAVVAQAGHPGDSTGWVKKRYAAVATFAAGLIDRQSNYVDIDDARAAAERLAQDRGRSVS